MAELQRWWQSHRDEINGGATEVGNGLRRFARRFGRLMVIGIILNVIASHFYPDFPQRFPVIYGWFDGWLQLGEFAVKAAVKAIYALFTGHFGEFWAEYTTACDGMRQQFITWLSSLHF